MIDGKPIEEESWPLSFEDGDCREPTRYLLLHVRDSGDLSVRRSSNVRVLGLDCDSLLPLRA